MNHSGHSDSIKDLEMQIKHLKRLGTNLFSACGEFWVSAARNDWAMRRDVTFIYGRASDDTSRPIDGVAKLITSKEVSSRVLKLLKDLT